jgi:hypothetical protein
MQRNNKINHTVARNWIGTHATHKRVAVVAVIQVVDSAGEASPVVVAQYRLVARVASPPSHR